MDEHPRHRTEKKSGSSSRSPSLSRRPSLKDKKASGTIVKVKGKKSSASGSKKERWLLTRKTWRYMSDAVGNLLPESHRMSTTSAVPGPSSAIGLGSSTAGVRRTSAGAAASEGAAGISHIIHGVADIPGEGLFAGAGRPKSTPSSTATSPTYGGVMSFPSHRPGVTPTGPGPGKFFSPPPQSQQQILIATDKFYPPSDDIPTLEKHFDAVCSKEKRFLLWTRTKPKGPSGPALREMKKQRKEQRGKSGKQPGESFGHRGSTGSILEALHLRLGSSSTTAGAAKEHILGGDYNSPTTEEEDDDYDEYDDSDEITVRERRKSSTASSASMVGMGQCWTQGSLTFFRPLSTLSSHGSESSYSMIVNPQGITKICRNTGTQTDPFPEELLIRFRLQAVEEERQQQSLRQASPDNRSDATTANSPMSPVRLDTMQKVSSPPPPTTTASSPMSPTTSTDGGLGRASSGSGRESEEKLLETGSSARPSISGQSESMATTKSGEGTSTTTTTTTDKKSEESGYSSSISDTVMRYLRMVRKNSKADNKDTIDKFKTVNYDRSLRYIKSKNVTVEEALEHEKNKQQASQQAAQVQKPPEKTEPQKQQRSGNADQAAATVTSSDDGTSTSAPRSPAHEKAMSPSQDTSKRKSSLASTKGAGSSGAQSPTSPSALNFPDFFAPPGNAGTVATASEQAQLRREESQGTALESSIPPSSSPGPVHSPPLSPSALSSLSQSPESGFSPQHQQNIQQQQQSQQQLHEQQKAPSSIGIQAGESLVHFLRSLNLNPMARKMSDFSSSCCSSDSPADVFSPRYSFAANVASGSASDADMFGGGGGVHQTAMASMMAMAAASSMRGPQYEVADQSAPQLPSDMEGASEYEDAFQGMRSSFFSKQSQSHQSGPLSSSWSSSATTTQAGETAIKKSSSSSSSYSFSQLFHYKPLQRSRDHTTVGLSPETTSTPATPTTSSIGGSSGGLMKSFFGSSPFSSTFGLKKSSLRKPTSTTSLTITTNTGSDSMSGRVNAPPPTTSSSPNLLSLIHSSAASASTGFTNLFSSRGVGGGSGSSVTCTNTSRTGEFQQNLVSSATSSSGELRAQEASGTPLYAPLYSRSSLPICGESGKTSTGLVEGNYQHRHHPHHVFHGSGRSGGSVFMARGLSDLIFSHGSGSSTTSARKGSSTRYVDMYLTPTGVMQKSKSSSSVLPLYGSSASVSGPPGPSSSTAQLRVSPSSSIGGGGDAAAPSSSEQVGAGAGASGSSSGGSRLISKSKLFKSRSKSSTRVATSSTGSAVCTWSPQGRCKWKSVSGKVVVLEPTTILNLSEVERLTLQEVALEKLRALNLGVEIKIPKEKVGGGQQKPKRRPYLLKKKALSTGFFESGSKREEGKETSSGGSGLVFGISLSQCLANDRLRQMKLAAAASLSSSTADGEQQQITPQSHSHNKRSQNGSRNSVSSVFEMPKEDPFQPPQSACVPAFVTACIDHIEAYGLHTTGIFRVSTSLKRIRQLREDIDGGKEIQFGADHSPHDIAALLKEFLRDLPEPLLSRDLYHALLKTQKIRNRKLQLEAIQHLVQLLPVTNRDTLAALLKLFSKVVANCGETRSKTGELLPGNKMEGYSLATLIAPNILPCMPTEGAGVVSSASSMDQNSVLANERRESIDLVNYMISNPGIIFDVTPELLHDVYLHLMDTNPEAIEGILRLRAGPTDEGIDELETTSSVFEESEGGEAIDPEDTVKATTTRIYRRREDILHEGAGKGGSEEVRTRERTRERRDEQVPSITQSSGTTSDVEKQTQSGGESDSSVGTRSTSRWFRRSRGDTKGRTSSDSGSEKVKVSSRKRESSLFETKRASSLDSVNVPESTAPATPQSLLVSPRRGTVTDPIPGRPLSGSDQSLRVPDTFLNTRRQSSPVLESSGIITASLKIPVPVSLNIDDSDIPFIEDDNSGEAAMAHSYHHPVHQQQQQQQPATHHQAYLQYHQQSPLVQKYQPQSQYQYSHQTTSSSQPSQHPFSVQHSDLTLASTDVVRGRSMSTDSSVPMKTTSTTTTPISSPARQPSSEISSPASFSPPTSPPLYGTFPIEEMTARMFIGSAASSTQSTVLSTSPSMQQFHHRGAVTMTTPSSTSHPYPTLSSITKAATPKESYTESRSTSSTPVTRPKIEKSNAGSSTLSGSLSTSSGSVIVASASRIPTVSSSHLTLGTIPSTSSGTSATLSVPTQKPSEVISKSAPPSPQPSSSSASVYSSTSSTFPSLGQTSQSAPAQQQTGTQPSSVILPPAAEPKGLGKETKGANIGGLNKSKTADFEKIGTTKSQSASTVTETSDVYSTGAGASSGPIASSTPSYGGSHHQIYSIAPKMRLRSQENVLLKQQFLLRQQQHEMGESGPARKERTSQKGRTDQPAAEEQHQTEDPSSHAPKGGRQLTRRRIMGSASTSAIVTSKPTSTTTSATQRVRTRDSESTETSSSSVGHPNPPSSSNIPSVGASSRQDISPTTSSSSTATPSGTSPSRWKRSEIIASRQQSHPPSDPETFV